MTGIEEKKLLSVSQSKQHKTAEQYIHVNCMQLTTSVKIGKAVSRMSPLLAVR